MWGLAVVLIQSVSKAQLQAHREQGNNLYTTILMYVHVAVVKTATLSLVYKRDSMPYTYTYTVCFKDCVVPCNMILHEVTWVSLIDVDNTIDVESIDVDNTIDVKSI